MADERGGAGGQVANAAGADVALAAARRGRARTAGLIALLLLVAVMGAPITALAEPHPRPEPVFEPVPSDGLPRESVQADVSTRSVAITSSFTGTEIVVFGAVDQSRQSSAEAGLYDVVIVLEGISTSLVARRKNRVAGLWLNTQALTFQSVPSYYAIASTRPLDEIANDVLLRDNDIGFEQVRMQPISGWETGLTTADLQDFKSAVIRLKQRDRLYVQDEYGVAFIGRSLFRATIDLPANVPVGPLSARIHLFRQGQLLSTYTGTVMLRREGVERLLHDFAMYLPLAYGISTVIVAIGAGLLASALFRKRT